MGQRLIITEEERSTIKRLYISEQTVSYFYDSEGNLTDNSSNSYVEALVVHPNIKNNQYPKKVDLSNTFKVLKLVSSDGGYYRYLVISNKGQKGTIYSYGNFKVGDLIFTTPNQ